MNKIEFDEIHAYLQSQKYPDEWTKDQKRRLREKAEVFILMEGVLFHAKKKTEVIWDRVEQRKVVAHLHDNIIGGAHFGMSATFEKVASRFWWKGIQKDVRDYVRVCGPCQKTNSNNRPPPATLHPIKVNDIFHRWGVDFVGPLNETKSGMKYIAVATEYLTRWPEVQAISNKSAISVHNFLLTLVYRFGACDVLLNDQGREFNNHLVDELCQKVGTDQAVASACCTHTHTHTQHTCSD